jgi:hypothetical protein
MRGLNHKAATADVGDRRAPNFHSNPQKIKKKKKNCAPQVVPDEPNQNQIKDKSTTTNKMHPLLVPKQTHQTTIHCLSAAQLFISTRSCCIGVSVDINFSRNSYHPTWRAYHQLMSLYFCSVARFQCRSAQCQSTTSKYFDKYAARSFS